MPPHKIRAHRPKQDAEAPSSSLGWGFVRNWRQRQEENDEEEQEEEGRDENAR